MLKYCLEAGTLLMVFTSLEPVDLFVNFSAVSISDDCSRHSVFIKSLFSQKKNRLCYDQEQEIFSVVLF